MQHSLNAILVLLALANINLTVIALCQLNRA